jgi:hypothetical protein
VRQETNNSQFGQVGFSATRLKPSGQRAESERSLFPHILADFDLKAAMKSNEPSTAKLAS